MITKRCWCRAFSPFVLVWMWLWMNAWLVVCCEDHDEFELPEEPEKRSVFWVFGIVELSRRCRLLPVVVLDPIWSILFFAHNNNPFVNAAPQWQWLCGWVDIYGVRIITVILLAGHGGRCGKGEIMANNTEDWFRRCTRTEVSRRKQLERDKRWGGN